MELSKGRNWGESLTSKHAARAPVEWFRSKICVTTAQLKSRIKPNSESVARLQKSLFTDLPINIDDLK